MHKTELRRQLRAKRRDLDQTANRAQLEARINQALIQQLRHTLSPQRRLNIAAYLAQDGEVDVSHAIVQAAKLGHNIWLPAVIRQPLISPNNQPRTNQPHNVMQFRRFEPFYATQNYTLNNRLAAELSNHQLSKHSSLETENQYGLIQPKRRSPARRHLIRANQLDMIWTPLVGFDAHGHRLGMGGGFYDRFFNRKLLFPSLPPILNGIAFECQRQTKLTTEHWDVQLNAITTEQGYQTATPPY